MKLRIGLPKGSLQESTRELFRRAGYSVVFGERSYYPSIDDPELDALLIRSQEIPRYVDHGILDVGIAGSDMIGENDADVVRIADLLYSKASLGAVRWVLAVPESSEINSVEDLEGKTIAALKIGSRDTAFVTNVLLGGEVDHTYFKSVILAPNPNSAATMVSLGRADAALVPATLAAFVTATQTFHTTYAAAMAGVNKRTGQFLALTADASRAVPKKAAKQLRRVNRRGGGGLVVGFRLKTNRMKRK